MDSTRKPQGFTLIELMIVVAVLGIFAAIAVPSFTQFVSNNQTQSLRNETTSLLQLARATAITNREALSVCIDNEEWSLQTDCKDDATDALRVVTPPKNVVLSADRTSITFNGNGTAPATDITVCQNDDASNGYTISIKSSGHIRQFPRGLTAGPGSDVNTIPMSTCAP